MDKKKIKEHLKCMLHTEKELDKRCDYLIDISFNLVEAKLKDKKHEENDILNILCAALVNSWITQEIAANAPSGRFCGNGYKINVDAKKQCEAAKKMLTSWRVLAANFLVDEGFCFYAVKEF